MCKPMKIIKHLQLNGAETALFKRFPCVIAMGTFDGLHRGHQKVIARARDYAIKHGLKLAVLTFSNHPYTAINPAAIPPQLITQEEKICLLKEWGVSLLIDIPFNREFSLLSPAEFLQRLTQFNFQALVCGANFSYGFRGAGNTETLKQFGLAHGFDMVIQPLAQYQDEAISSTRIRCAIAEGRLEDARNMLGRFYSVQGVVQKGRRRGRKLGFPTANIPVDRCGTSLPPSGTYIIRARIEDVLYDGVGNLGMNPTFDDVFREVLEVHLLNCHQDLYGKNLTVIFCQFLRKERRFTSLQELTAQLEKDRQAACAYFAAGAG